MENRRTPTVVACAVGACLVVALSAGFGQPPAPVRPPADVLVVHDSLAGSSSSGLVCGNAIADLLGHFGLKAKLESLEEYRPGDISRYRFTVVLGVDDRNVVFPQSLLNDVKSSPRPLMWLNRHISDVLRDAQFSARIGLRLSSTTQLEGYDRVNYRGRTLLKGEPSLFALEITDPARVQVVATAAGNKVPERPYVVRSGDFWYFADSPFAFAIEGDRFWVFCDLLHDFLGMPHGEERKALVRIEDVSVEDDVDQLRAIADYLHDRGIPFQISLIPIFKDPERNEEIYLSDRPQFVRAIQYMVSRGGLVVMHGVTHQARGKSGDDFEFWDDLSDRPVAGELKTITEQKLKLGLRECFRNGIYPVTWETPHYMAPPAVYQTVARYFNSSYDRIPSTEKSDSGHALPYTAVDRWGRFIIPECLGFVSHADPNPDLIVTNAGRLTAVRDGVASFFFHPFMDRQYLERIVDGIQAAGYHFVSIRDYDLRLQMDNWLTQTYTDAIGFSAPGMYIHRLLLHSDGRKSAESNTVKPVTALVRDPGVVPPDAILVMEALAEVQQSKEEREPGLWERALTWARSKLPSQPAPGSIVAQPEAVILWDDTFTKGDWNNQESYRSALAAFGFQVTTVSWRDVGRATSRPYRVVVVPRAAALKLSPRQEAALAGFVADGGHVVLDGVTPLSQRLGISPEKRTIRVRAAEDALFGSRKTPLIDSRLTWNPPADVDRFVSRNTVAVYARDEESELPLATLLRSGKGLCLYLAARLDPHTPFGYSRYPFFVHYLLTGFGLRLPAQQTQLELYFDPGQRQGVDIERLADQWRHFGVRAVYAAAYHFWPAWSYDYGHMIEVCHKNGILVYAWFELPHVSKKFWDDHPGWRARTAAGEEGLVGWRYHMDLDITECRDAAFGFVEGLLKAHPWDGVNIAELNYDSDNGPENPRKYLPMGASTRAAFAPLGGFDPIQLFDPGSPHYWKNSPQSLRKFEDYRSQRVLSWHRAMLERITPLAREKDIEVIVTMLDSLHSKTLRRDTGVDSAMIVALMREFPFTLQVEDPAHFWGGPPDRYKRFAATYLKMVPDGSRLMFDVNVVPERALTGSFAPTQTLSGIELAQTLLFASAPTGRAGIYSEGTIAFEDLQFLGRVLARGATVEARGDAWVTTSDRSVLLTAPGAWRHFYVDDHLWPGWGDNEVCVPPGKHTITAAERKFRFFDRSVLDIRLLRFTGNLDSLSPTTRGLVFSYNSQPRTSAVFNRRPFEIHVDGRDYGEAPVQLGGNWAVRLPRGRHQVEIIADSAAYVILDATSLYSSWLIVVFGAVAIGLMFLIYMSVLVRRTASRAVRSGAGTSKSGESRT